MKLELDYNFVKQMAINIADQAQKDYQPDCVYAIARGGVSFGHIVARHLALPLYVINIDNDQVKIPSASYNKILITEDIVSLGRTLSRVINAIPFNIEYRTAALVLDHKFSDSIVDYYGIKTKQWVCFPWEETNKVKEGDRGLFRNKTDKYGEA